ncbi:unnamed protein product [Cylicocyclus nassatus]|uniref:Uncharacterized protein n=1 Tax=Cylicocyclus nassatus TaxID=53992 RepID=A0AA36H6C2_CYLNA|nr:unnamed protein product [Cylicocyclus nassatus]
MLSMRVLLLLALIIAVTWAFDKNLLKKGKKSGAYEKHPISRRVLRFERSLQSAEFPQPGELPFQMLDYAKILPEIPAKYKPSRVMPDTDYQPDLEF